MNDLISRQAAIDELDKGAWGVEWDKALAKAMIESLPSAQPETMFYPQIDGVTPSVIAQPEQKKGEWLEHYAHEDGERDGVWCSECREHYYFGGQLMNFCPNCGADMRGEKHDL